MPSETEIKIMKQRGDRQGLINIIKNHQDDVLYEMLCFDAAEALAQLEDELGLDYLINKLANPNSDTRSVAIEILKRLNNPQGNLALTSVTTGLLTAKTGALETTFFKDGKILNPFWSNPHEKTKRLLRILALAFLFSSPNLLIALSIGGISVFLDSIFFFPTGLLQYITHSSSYSKSAFNLAVISIWLIYFTISIAIVISHNKTVVRSLFIILVILLILNISGCYRIMP